MKTARFGIGTKYTPKGKDYVCTVTDILSTRNVLGELVSLEYVGSYFFCGQPMTRKDVDTTVAMGLLEEVKPAQG